VSRPRIALVGAAAALLVLLAPASAALAQGSPHFQRGHLPVIGEIKLEKKASGRIEISAPITYTQALSGGAPGLESSLVVLKIAAKLKHGRPVGQEFWRGHSGRITAPAPAPSSSASCSIPRAPSGC
jgi:hypothetical protein